jgi:DNA-damage-inducible protein J
MPERGYKLRRKKNATQRRRSRAHRQGNERGGGSRAEIGLNVSDAIRLLLIRIAREGALPFDPFVPNKETIAAMKEARAELIKVGSVDRLIAELNADDPEDEAIQERLQADARGTVRRRA